MGTPGSHDHLLTGEVIEVLESGDQHSTKLLVKPFYLTIPNSSDAHLGDTLYLNVTLELISVRPTQRNSSVTKP